MRCCKLQRGSCHTGSQSHPAPPDLSDLLGTPGAFRGMGPDVFVQMAQALAANTSLTTLNLVNNGIGPSGAGPHLQREVSIEKLSASQSRKTSLLGGDSGWHRRTSCHPAVLLELTMHEGPCSGRTASGFSRGGPTICHGETTATRTATGRPTEANLSVRSVLPWRSSAKKSSCNGEARS